METYDLLLKHINIHRKCKHQNNRNANIGNIKICVETKLGKKHKDVNSYEIKHLLECHQLRYF